MISIELGTIVAVSLRTAGTQLVGDHAIGVTELLVDDCYDLIKPAGSLTIGDETLTYSRVDDELSTVYLDAATTVAYDDLAPIGALPAAPVKVATVTYPGAGEGVPARLLHVLDSLLPEGVRDPVDQEDILLLVDDHGLPVVLDVLGRESKIDPKAIAYPTVTNLCTDPKPVDLLTWFTTATPMGNPATADSTYSGTAIKIDDTSTFNYGTPFALPSTGPLVNLLPDNDTPAPPLTPLVPLDGDLGFAFNIRAAAALTIYAGLSIYDASGAVLASANTSGVSGCIAFQSGRTVNTVWVASLGTPGYDLPALAATRVWFGVDKEAVLAIQPSAAFVQFRFTIGQPIVGGTNVKSWLGNGSIYAGSDIVAFADADTPGWLGNEDGTSTGRGPIDISWDQIDHPDLFPPEPHTQLAASITDFLATVRGVRLDEMATPTANVSMGGKKITSLGTPTAGTDAATKDYVDANAGTGVVASIVAGANVSVDNTDPANPVVSASGGGGGGGSAVGFSGNWTAGSYDTNEMVAFDGMLWAARTPTSAQPETGAFPSTAVGGSDWSRNSVASTVSTNEVILINNVSGDNASICSNTTFTGWTGLTIEADLTLNGTADGLHLGILDSSAPATSISASTGMEGVTGFYGIYLDIYNSRIRATINGVTTATGSFAHSAKTTGYEKWTIVMTDTGTNWTLAVSRATVGLLTTFTTTKPAFTTYRMAVGCFSGGLAGTFKVRGTPHATTLSADWRRLATLIDAA